MQLIGIASERNSIIWTIVPYGQRLTIVAVSLNRKQTMINLSSFCYESLPDRNDKKPQSVWTEIHTTSYQFIQTAFQTL